jgi:hypothetical protein
MEWDMYIERHISGHASRSIFRNAMINAEMWTEGGATGDVPSMSPSPYPPTRRIVMFL